MTRIYLFGARCAVACSWISLAFGGVPVDRNNRDRAVKALKRSTDAAKNEKLCIAIAPEGTRSLTGHLLPFKKGTFFCWVLLFYCWCLLI